MHYGINVNQLIVQSLKIYLHVNFLSLVGSFSVEHKQREKRIRDNFFFPQTFEVWTLSCSVFSC